MAVKVISRTNCDMTLNENVYWKFTYYLYLNINCLMMDK